MFEVPLAYYPGCSSGGLGRPYEQSMRLVLRELGIRIEEIRDWNCCGATSAHGTDEMLDLALSARNLALAGGTAGRSIMTPCPGCYSNLVRVAGRLKAAPLRREAEEVVGARITDVRVVHLLDLLTREEVAERVLSRLKYRLKDLKVACYYGCLIVRPHRVTGFDDPENPRSMDELLRRLGVEAVDWAHKAECCGGSLSVHEPELAAQRVDEVLHSARQAGAEVVAVACSLCQSNLELRQASNRGSRKLPVVFFTQLMGLALGFSARQVGLNRLLAGSFSWREKLVPA